MYRSGEIRVSEQEARFVFAESLASTPYLYSIETPTTEGYQLTGSRPMSAQTDLTVYDHDRQPLLNVEFKAKGYSTAAKSLFSLEKDIQKLLREPVPGMWFHVLGAVDNATLTTLLAALAKALFETSAKFKNDIRQTRLIFHLCVIKQRFSLHKHIVVDPENSTLENLYSRFQFKYSVSRSALTDLGNANVWQVDDPQTE
jgi:hypothetical protein